MPNDKLDERITALEEAVEVQSRPHGSAFLPPIPEHGAGPGETINPTWSKREQEQSSKGGSAIP